MVRAQIARQEVQVFKPAIDARYSSRPANKTQRLAADSSRVLVGAGRSAGFPEPAGVLVPEKVGASGP